MDAATANGSNPPEFMEDTKDSLFKPMLTESTEFWLMQWPIHQLPDFDGQELLLELHQDGKLGSFKGPSGKEYLVNSVGKGVDATVFQSAGSESKIVGKISRRVTLAHFPNLDELKVNRASSVSKKQLYQKSRVTLTNSSHHFAALRDYQSKSSHRASMHSSRLRSSLSKAGELSKSLKNALSMPTSAHSAVISSNSVWPSKMIKKEVSVWPSKMIKKEV